MTSTALAYQILATSRSPIAAVEHVVHPVLGSLVAEHGGEAVAMALEALATQGRRLEARRGRARCLATRATKPLLPLATPSSTSPRASSTCPLDTCPQVTTVEGMSKRINGVGRVTVSKCGATLTMTKAATREWDTNRADGKLVRQALDSALNLAREHGTCDIMSHDGVLLRQVKAQS